MILTVDGIDYTFDNLKVKTQSLPLFPQKRVSQEYVIGRDSAVTFDDGFTNKKIRLGCEFVSGNILENQRDIRILSGVMYKPGYIRLDYESDKKYKARLIDIQNMVPGASSNQISLIIDTDAVALSAYKDGSELTWNEADIEWILADFPWAGYTTTYNGNGTHTIINDGNYKSMPIVRMTADSGDVTLTLGTQTFTYTGLTETVNVDSGTLTVYTDSLQNRKSSHSGDFIELEPGENDIIVTGTAVNLVIEYIYDHTWI